MDETRNGLISGDCTNENAERHEGAEFDEMIGPKYPCRGSYGLAYCSYGEQLKTGHEGETRAEKSQSRGRSAKLVEAELRFK